jgi:DNA-binding NarL/FixJ family response regulator
MSEAIRSGTAGFLVKDTDPDELVQAVKWSPTDTCSPRVTSAADWRVLLPRGAASARACVLGELTDPERELLALAGK